ncbi:MAG TPA: hypothetical protein VEU96_24615 [Bryobacteraceae bacterium]|nr:hypothetical protein [Bryobacteraceae bacterium]
MAKADDDDGTIVPPTPDPNPPAAQVTGKQQALKQLKSIKKQLDAVEKWVKKLPNKPPAKK